MVMGPGMVNFTGLPCLGAQESGLLGEYRAASARTGPTTIGTSAS